MFSDNWYLAETLLTTAHKSGLRATVYETAGRSGAFYSNENKNLSIYYRSSDTLTVSVLFKDQSHCGIFQSTLESMVMRCFDRDATVVHNRAYTAVAWSPNLIAVLASDYVSADNPESYEYSLYSTPSVYDAVVDVNIQMQPLLWERADLSCFSGGCKGERCHLMSQTWYKQHASDENNILIMSAENHFRFDVFYPKIAINWVGETDRVVTTNGEELTFCEIQIVCVNEEVFKCVRNNIKIGAIHCVETLTFTTSVAVPTPSLFKQYLTFKYWETLGLQEASAVIESKQAKIARVRATVTERMRSELGDDLTIDLNVSKKDRGAAF